jgi:putative Mg2+ transporter-C (MgtC) family protein
MDPRSAIFVDLDDMEHLFRVLVRLLVAMVLGTLLGLQREHQGKVAGLRTHTLVCLGAALFIIVAVEAGIARDHLSRVVQGLVIGIGFLGGGTIIKLPEQQRIRGLTTAANIWLTAAVGMAVGLGQFWPALLATALALMVLSVFGWLEHRLEDKNRDKNQIIQGN